MENPTNLSHWFPLIEKSGLPVPKTHILPMPDGVIDDVWAMFDGGQGTGALATFAQDLKRAASDLGTPVFLRSDLTSAKHDWSTCCYVTDLDKLAEHVFGIAYFSEIHGIAWDGNWVVREFLPTMPVGNCPNFGAMPVCKEFRFFVNGSDIECFHPYWPQHALEQGGADISDADFEALCRTPDIDELKSIVSKAGAAVGGRWSVDLLATKRGWFLTDMAVAESSWHWEGCPANKQVKP
jgi:hypothetical protein